MSDPFKGYVLTPQQRRDYRLALDAGLIEVTDVDEEGQATFALTAKGRSFENRTGYPVLDDE